MISKSKLLPHLNNEYAPIKTVLMHKPGAEVESVSPDSAKDQLYNDIIPLEAVQQEYARIWDFMARVSDVFDPVDVLAASLSESRQISAFVDRLLSGAQAFGQIPDGKREEISGRLQQRSPVDIAQTVVRGLRKESSSFSDHFNPAMYDLMPLPNLYFSRDAAMAYRDSVLIGAMAHGVRRNEALIQQHIWSWVLGEDEIAYSGLRHQLAWPESDIRLEGGDVLVADTNVLIVGISQRTSPGGLDAAVRSLVNRYDEPIEVIAVPLPDRRATIHLDMIFTFLDGQSALVYEPLVSGPHRLGCTVGSFSPGRSPRFRDVHGLPEALASLNMPVNCIGCGGDDPHLQQREQWFSGTNVFAFGPEKILCYENNTATLEQLHRTGYDIISIREPRDWNALSRGEGKVAFTAPGTELARGGGGLRCMTMPISRFDMIV